LIINDPEFVARGALACAGLGFYKSGYAAATLAARVLLGESPQHLPFEEVTDMKLCLNFQVAKAFGITFPPDLIRKASHFSHLAARFGRPAKIALIASHNKGVAAREREERLDTELGKIGLARGIDFTMETYQTGDQPDQLAAAVATVQEDSVDAIVVEDEAVQETVAKAVRGRPTIALSRFVSQVSGTPAHDLDLSRVTVEIARLLAAAAP
jgi:hypothetical protein